jgi:pimeloyl-ACP methyl ester carboxylesterase
MTKRDFVFKNRNDKRIQSTLRKPKGNPKGTIILLHGLGGWKEQPLIVIIAETLCEKGYNVFTFDAADGAKGPDADFKNSTTTGYLDDLDDVVGYVTNADWYAGPLMLAGHSLGGTIAIRYTRLHPSQITKLMLFAPAVSWKKANALSFAGGIWWIIGNKNKTPGPNHSKLALDRTWLFDFMKFNGKKDAPYISAPTLIVSASKDSSIVSPKAHYSLAKWFPNATNIVIPGAGHVFWKHERKLADTIAKWLTSS